MHVHSNDLPVFHTHAHQHSPNNGHTHSHQNKIKNSYYTSFSVGILHGLAGVAHFILFIPILGFTSVTAATQFIIGFAIGTVLAMDCLCFGDW